jgi:hypothetical protein
VCVCKYEERVGIVDDSQPECGEGDKDESSALIGWGGWIMASDNFHPIDPCHFTGLDKWQRDYWSVLIKYLLTFRARDLRSHKPHSLTPCELLNTHRRWLYQCTFTTQRLLALLAPSTVL